jgi:hypothetical protein
MYIEENYADFMLAAVTDATAGSVMTFVDIRLPLLDFDCNFLGIFVKSEDCRKNEAYDRLQGRPVDCSIVAVIFFLKLSFASTSD